MSAWVKSDLLRALGQRPIPIKEKSDWEKMAAIVSEACDVLPRMVDLAEEGEDVILMHVFARDLAVEAVEQVSAALKELDVPNTVVREDGWLLLSANGTQLRAVAERERAKTDAAFLEMMRNR